MVKPFPPEPEEQQKWMDDLDRDFRRTMWLSVVVVILSTAVAMFLWARG